MNRRKELLNSNIYEPREFRKIMNVGRYRHNYEGFYENFMYAIFINTPKVANANYKRNFLLSYFFLLVKCIDNEI